MSLHSKSQKLFQALSNVSDSLIVESSSQTKKRKFWKRWAISIAAAFALIITSIVAIPQLTRNDNGLQMKIVYPTAYAFESEKFYELADQYPVKEDFITNMNHFSYKTAVKLISEKDNINYSPLSLYYALAVSSTGANGETAQEFQKLLGDYSAKDLSLECNHLYHQLYRDNKVTTLKLANSLWMNHSKETNYLKPKQSFITNAAHNYYASSHVADFSKSSTNKAMSQWFSEQSNQHLKPTISVNANQLLSILNTVSFKGQWTDQFDKSLTKEDIFTTSQDKKVSCDFMNRMNQTSFTKTDKYTKASLHLKDGYSMTFILPSQSSSIKDLASSPEQLQSIFSQESSAYGKVTWKVPKMDFASSLNLASQLKELGLNQAFSQDADFTNMTDSPTWISSIKQNTRITLDEDGVTASAFTQIDMDGSALPTDNAEMILDRPFLYAITSGNGCILFMGCFNQP